MSLKKIHVKGKTTKAQYSRHLSSNSQRLASQFEIGADRKLMFHSMYLKRLPASKQTLIIQPTHISTKKKIKPKLNSLIYTNTLLREGWTDTERGVLLGLPRSAICVQRFDDSLNSAIRITYRISLRSSSLREPRYPLLRVVILTFK